MKEGFLRRGDEERFRQTGVRWFLRGGGDGWFLRGGGDCRGGGFGPPSQQEACPTERNDVPDVL